MLSKKKASSQKSTKKTIGNDPSLGKSRKCFKLAADCKMGFVSFKCNGRGHISRDCPGGGPSGSGNQGSALMSAKTKKANPTTQKQKTKAETTPIRKPMESPVMLDQTKVKCEDRYVDSGVMQHMTNRRDWFTEYKPFISPKSMDSAKNGITLQVLGSSRVVVQTYNGHTWNERSFLDVWFSVTKGQPEGRRPKHPKQW